MNAIAKIMAVQVTLQGVAQAQKGLDDVAKKIEGVDKAARDAAKKGIAQLAGAAAFLGSSLYMAMGDQFLVARLQTFTGEGEKLRSTLEQVSAIASRGLFKEDDAMRSAIALERAGAGASEWLGVVKNLASLNPDAGMEGIAEMIGRVAGQGDTARLGMQLRQMGFGPAALRAAGLNVSDKMEITNTPQEIAEGLKKLSMNAQRAAQDLENTPLAQFNAMMYRGAELAESFGYSFLAAVSPVASVLSWLFGIMQGLNEATDGWFGRIVMTVVALNGFAKVAPVLTGILTTMRSLLSVQALYNMLTVQWGNLVKFTTALVGVLRNLFSVQKLLIVIEAARAMVQSAIAAAMGNIPGALMAVGLLGAAGFAAYKMADWVGGMGDASQLEESNKQIAGTSTEILESSRNIERLLEGPSGLPGAEKSQHDMFEDFMENVRGQSGGVSGEAHHERPRPRPAAETPNRRDDIERLYEKLYGKAWTG